MMRHLIARDNPRWLVAGALQAKGTWEKGNDDEAAKRVADRARARAEAKRAAVHFARLHQGPWTYRRNVLCGEGSVGPCDG